MIGPLEQILLAGMACFIMLGIGAALTPHDFQVALRRPHRLGIGLISQYGFMPLIGFSLSLMLDLPDPAAIGLLILSCMPAGPLSNMFTYFARGNLALSVSMTVASTMSGVLMIPLLLSIYASALDLEIPYQTIVISLLLLLAPLSVGMALRRWNEAAGSIAEKLGAAFAIVFIVFLILSWVPKNANFLRNTGLAIYVAAIMLGIFGFVSGYCFTRFLRLCTRDARTVALETGIQNAPLAIAAISLSFAPKDQQSVLAIVALYSLFIVITSSLATICFRWTYPVARDEAPRD